MSIKAKWTVYGNAYYCIKCGLESNPSKTQKGARENWNKAVETYKAIETPSLLGRNQFSSKEG